jgi:MtN3 and saliva related transmembrane protein
MFTSILGVLAAALTSLSYIPQAMKAAPRNSTDDLSLKMLGALLAGLCLWIVYGIALGDWIIITANVIGASLVAFVCACKVRDMRGERQ